MRIFPLVLFPLVMSSFAASALSGGVDGTGNLQSAVPIAYKTLQVDGGISYYSGDDLGFRDQNGKSLPGSGAERFDMAGAVTYGVLPYLEAGFLYPYYLDKDQNGKEFKGLGDVRTSFKFNYPPYPHKKGFDVSLLAQMDWPTGTLAGKYGGYTRHSWYTVSGTNDDSTRNAFGARGPTLITQMLTTANLGAIDGFIPLMLHLNWGAAFTGSSSQNSFLLGGGAEITPYPAVSIFWSFNSEISITQASRSIPIMDYPFASSAGLQLNFPKYGIEAYTGIHFVINDIPDTVYSAPMGAPSGTPVYERFPGFGWFGGLSTKISFLPKDGDLDGIYGDRDRCPLEPEDMDNFEDDDGCPDLDNDKDGIVDLKDKCPNQAEDMDGFEDEDGCPELDNDGDSVPDALDKCPIAPEDRDGFQDEDGCPDPDNDGDGVIDAQDKCPTKVEDMDGFQDEDGCPDVDNDNDGIPDNLDRCPNQPENVNGVDDGDGCPDTQPTLPQQGPYTPQTGAKPGVSSAH